MTEDKHEGIFGVIGPKFLERFKSGKRTEIAYVKDVTETPNGIAIEATSTHGEPFFFFFDPNAERFKDAQDGFSVGDYITQEMSGSRIISARKLKLNQNEKEKLAKQFKSIGEDG